MNMGKITVVLIALILLASLFVVNPANAQPKTIIVPDNYPTIQSAVNNASDGDRVFVRAGRYNENLVINKPISLVGEGQDRAIICGNVTVGILIRSDNVTVKGFKVIMFLNVWYWYGMHLLSVKNCNVYNNRIENAYYGVWLYDSSSSNNIYENTFTGNGYGINIEVSNDNTIVKNTITGNNQFGIYNTRSSNNKIIGNYLSSNFAGIAVNSYSSPPSSQSNLIYGNTLTGNKYTSSSGE